MTTTLEKTTLERNFIWEEALEMRNAGEKKCKDGLSDVFMQVS